eukprot:4850377-Prymnesium_polylepis.1
MPPPPPATSFGPSRYPRRNATHVRPPECRDWWTARARTPERHETTTAGSRMPTAPYTCTDIGGPLARRFCGPAQPRIRSTGCDGRSRRPSRSSSQP